MIGIYKITNLVNGKCYIGQSTNIKKRWVAHRSDAFNEKSEAYHYPLYRAMRKYGIEKFSFEVLEECSSELLDEKEVFFIKQYNAYGDGGYNQDEGGGNAIHGNKLTKDQIIEIHVLLKDRKLTMREIAEQYDVHYNTIKTINNGIAWVVDGVKYPIRKVPLSVAEAKVNSTDDGVYIPLKDREYFCTICGAKLSDCKATLCRSCCDKKQRKVSTRPAPLELARLIKESSFVDVGRRFGVDGNAIKKWCKAYKIPHKKDELIKWYNDEVGIKEEPKHQKPKGEKTNPIQIKQIDFSTRQVLAVFNSCKEAARHLKDNGSSATINTIYTNIGRVVKGTRKTCEGFFWEYA